MTFEQAREKAEKMAKENNRQFYFVMGKNDNFEVFVGWDGRDEAIKKGYVFARYSISQSRWATEWDEVASGKFGEFCL